MAGPCVSRSLFRPLLKTFGKQLWITGILQLIYVLLGLTSPLFRILPNMPILVLIFRSLVLVDKPSGYKSSVICCVFHLIACLNQLGIAEWDP